MAEKALLKTWVCRKHPGVHPFPFRFTEFLPDVRFCSHCLRDYFIKLGFAVKEIEIDTNGNEVSSDK